MTILGRPPQNFDSRPRFNLKVGGLGVSFLLIFNVDEAKIGKGERLLFINVGRESKKGLPRCYAPPVERGNLKITSDHNSR